MRVVYDRVAAIDVHKDMVKVAIRVPGAKRGTRKTDVLEFRTFYGVLQAMARELRGRGVTHVVMEASGVYTDPVYYALRELDFTEVMVINPAHAKALKGHKTDAKDAIRLLDLYECGLLSGSCIPDPDLREVRDLARYRMKTVQARTSEIQRLQKALETAGIKLSSVVHRGGLVRPRVDAGQASCPGQAADPLRAHRVPVPGQVRVKAVDAVPALMRLMDRGDKSGQRHVFFLPR